MKKKLFTTIFLVGMGALLFFNIKIAKEGTNQALTLNSLSFFSQAQAEDSSTNCQGLKCENANGLWYKTWTKADGTRICCGTSSTTDRGCKES